METALTMYAVAVVLGLIGIGIRRLVMKKREQNYRRFIIGYVCRKCGSHFESDLKVTVHGLFGGITTMCKCGEKTLYIYFVAKDNVPTAMLSMSSR